MKIFILSILLIALLLPLPALADQENNTGHTEVIAAIPRSFPPQYFINDQGQPAGLAIDLIEAITSKAGIKLSYQVMDSWTEVYDALQQGKVHLVPDMGITDERKKFTDFTIPVETFAISIFVRLDSVDLKSINDLSGKRVGAVEGNVGMRLLKGRKDIEIIAYKGFHEALLELISGHIDGIVYPEPVVWKLAQEVGLEHKIRMLSPPLKEVKRAIGVIKDHSDLYQRLQQTTSIFIHSKEFEEILAKWYSKPSPYWTIQRLLLAMIFVVVILVSGFLLWRYFEMVSLNKKLRFETRQKRAAESSLQQLNTELEERIEQRTKELAEAQRIGQMGSWEYDLVTDKLNWSEETYRIFEIDSTEFNLSYKAFLDSIHPEDRDRVNQVYFDSVSSHSTYVITHRLLFPDNRIKWVEERGESSYNEQGEAIFSKGIVQDITGQKQAELALLEQHNLLMTFIETIPDAVYIKDGRGAWQFVNQLSLSLFQIEDFPWQGKTENELAIERPEFRSAHEACQISDEKAWNAGNIVVDYEYTTDPDGNQLVFEVRKMPLFDEQKNRKAMLIIGRDITKQKSSQKQLQLAASVFTHANEGISITDPDGNILDVNQAFTDITGYAHDEVIGKNPRVLQSGRHKPQFYKSMWDDLTLKGLWYGEIWNRRKDGQIYPEMLSINAVKDPEGNILHYVALFSDITRQKEYQQQLEHVAHFDTLTNLPNRVLLSDRLQQAMLHEQRTGQQLAVVYLDLDGFKEINDAYGHDTGDQLLMNIAARLEDALRDEDTIARIGGDEFVAVLSNLSHKNDCVPLLERMLASASQTLHINALQLQVSASLGVTFYPQTSPIDADQLLRQADQAMYQAKLSGKNRYQLFDMEQDRNLRGHHESLERIHLALTNKEFVLFYQPKVNMRTGNIMGAEALIRWQHPERGLLLPSDFLPVIENTYFSIELGDWVIETALTQLEVWHQTGLDLSVSVNIGALQLQQPDFCAKLISILKKHPGVKKGSLELEVLETSALEDMAYVSQIINRCKEVDINFALDDFGTGYSSLTYLKRLPASTLKIDRSFVRDMLDDPDDLAILEGILGLASAFQRKVIAEGVETVEHGELLLKLGCECAQGFGIARPMAAEKFPEWISNWQPFSSWQHIQQISRDDLPLLFAQIEHRAWVQTVQEYVEDKKSRPPSLSVNNCRFGQWLKKAGKERYGSLASYQEMLPLHDKIHQLGSELCTLQEQETDVQVKLKEFHDMKDTMLMRLNKLLNENQQ